MDAIGRVFAGLWPGRLVPGQAEVPQSATQETALRCIRQEGCFGQGRQQLEHGFRKLPKDMRLQIGLRIVGGNLRYINLVRELLWQGLNVVYPLNSWGIIWNHPGEIITEAVLKIYNVYN